MKYRISWMKVICFIMVVIPSFSYSQSILRQSINSYGSSGMIDNIQIRQTVGQAFSTSTFRDGIIGLNPGFQQVSLLSLNNKITKYQGVKVDIYPNPVSSLIKFRQSGSLGNLSIRICDVNGRIIYSNMVTNLNAHTIICEEWPDGIYAILIQDEAMQAFFSSKIIKAK